MTSGADINISDGEDDDHAGYTTGNKFLPDEAQVEPGKMDS
jgi:hypothetical protein